MQPTRLNITKRQFIAIGAVVVLIITLVVLMLFSFSQRLPEAQISKGFAGNIAFSKQMDDNTLYFFSGSAFVSYDLAQHKTTPLTRFYTMPGSIDTIAWSKQAALLEATTYSVTDEQYQVLTLAGLDPSLNYWWLFNFTNGTYTLVGSTANVADVRQAIWQDDDTFVYSEKVKDQPLLKIMRSDIGGQPTEIATLREDYELIAADASTIIYLRQEGLEQRAPSVLASLDMASKQETKLVDKVETVLAKGQDGSLLYINLDDSSLESEEGGTVEHDRGPLSLYDHKTRSSKKLEDTFGGTAAWQYNSDKWLAVGRNAQGEPISIHNEGNDIKRFKAPIREGEDYYAVGRTSQGDLIRDRFDVVYYSGNTKVENLPSAPDTGLLESTIYEPPFSMAYDSDFRQYKIYIITPPNKTGMEAALKYFRDKGIDPYQINTRWYGADSPYF